MDEIMLGKLKASSNAFIMFHLTELVLKEAAKAKDAPYVFEAKGDLTVAGTTNKVTMAVNITPLGDKKLKVTGTTSVKMSDYKVEPPVLVGILSTGDAVKLIFDWPLVLQAPAAAAK
jgi:polyisoprenoid-binding protein YceI